MWKAEALLLLCCLLAGATGAAAAPNLLQNGDFEGGLRGWETRKPAGGKIEVVPGPNGNCARLSSTDRSGSTYLIQRLDPARIKGKRLRLEAMMKGEDLAIGTFAYSQAKLTLVWSDGKAEHGFEVDFLNSFDWKKVGAVWAVGEDCVEATLYLGLHTTTGTMWLDNVVFTAPELKSQEPVAEGIERRVYDDGVVLRVDGREFAEARPGEAQAAGELKPTAAEAARKFLLFRTEDPARVYPGTVPTRGQVIDSLQALAAPDQYEALTFSLYALQPLGKVTVRPGALTGPGGATLPPTVFDARMGRYVMQRKGYTDPEYSVLPKLLVRSAEVAVTPERPQLYWLTVRVPAEARPGDYRGTVRVEADGRSVALPLTVRVPAVRLGKGKPWMLYFYNNRPQDAELYFRDMREHGMTSVILAQVQAPLRREGDRAVVDFASSDAFVAAYRKVGFTDPLVYNPFHDRLATILLDLFGQADRFPTVVNYGETIRIFKEGEYPEALQGVYRQVVRDIYDHVKQAGWPETIYYPVDEPNDPNDWRMAAARMEYRLTREAVPTARTFCTAYSIPIMQRLDPWLDVRACPVIPQMTTEKDRQAFADYLRKAGGEIWGIDWPAMWNDFWSARELAGFLPAKAGVTAMTSWTYYSPGPFTDEYNDLRGEYKRCLFVYRDTDGSLIPTVTWEGIRAGATDWRYVATLEQEVARARGAARERGERVLREVLAGVPWRSDSTAVWGNDRATQLRARLAEEIARLQAEH